MPSFSDYLQLLDRESDLRPRELAAEIRNDRSLLDWQRTTLLAQLSLRARQHTFETIRLPRVAR